MLNIADVCLLFGVLQIRDGYSKEYTVQTTSVYLYFSCTH